MKPSTKDEMYATPICRYPWECFRLGAGTKRTGRTGGEGLIVFVLRGTVRMSLASGKAHRADEKSMFTIPGHTRYTIRATKDARLATCLFDKACLEACGHNTDFTPRHDTPRLRKPHTVPIDGTLDVLLGLMQIYMGIADHFPEQLEMRRREVFAALFSQYAPMELAALFAAPDEAAAEAAFYPAAEAVGA